MNLNNEPSPKLTKKEKVQAFFDCSDNVSYYDWTNNDDTVVFTCYGIME